MKIAKFTIPLAGLHRGSCLHRLRADSGGGAMAEAYPWRLTAALPGPRSMMA